MTIDVTGLTPELLEKYDQPGPRYTSYPTAPHFSEDFDETAYRRHLQMARERSADPLSMYLNDIFTVTFHGKFGSK